jgi:hypothetical protein
MTPRYYSKNMPPLKLFIPARIRDYYLKLQKREGIMVKNTEMLLEVKLTLFNKI